MKQPFSTLINVLALSCFLQIFGCGNGEPTPQSNLNAGPEADPAVLDKSNPNVILNEENSLCCQGSTALRRTALENNQFGSPVPVSYQWTIKQRHLTLTPGNYKIFVRSDDFDPIVGCQADPGMTPQLANKGSVPFRKLKIASQQAQPVWNANHFYETELDCSISETQESQIVVANATPGYNRPMNGMFELVVVRE